MSCQSILQIRQQRAEVRERERQLAMELKPQMSHSTASDFGKLGTTRLARIDSDLGSSKAKLAQSLAQPCYVYLWYI